MLLEVNRSENLKVESGAYKTPCTLRTNNSMQLVDNMPHRLGKLF
jgi:hypothetical protein